MNRVYQLPFHSPIDLDGSTEGVWVADQDSRSLTCFSAAEPKPIARIKLDERPVGIAVVGDCIAAGLESGEIVCFQQKTGADIWRQTSKSGELDLQASGNFLWVFDRQEAALSAYDLHGRIRYHANHKLKTFGPAGEQAYWISDLRALHTTSREATIQLPDEAWPFGALGVCGNALFLSVSKALWMFDLRSLNLRVKLPAPEGPVPNLICTDQRLLGGFSGLFILDPAADAAVQSLPVHPESPLRGLAVSENTVWALERDKPTVHIIQIP